MASDTTGYDTASIVLIVFMYCTLIWTVIEIKQFIAMFNFNHPFFKCRQPKLNISYIAAFLFILYVLNPLTLLLANVLNIDSNTPVFINDVADALIFLVFFPRASILWFDRAFVDNLRNWVWRRELNIQDSNFLIHHRQYLSSPHIVIYSLYLLLVAPIFVTLKILPYFNVTPLFCDVMRTCVLMLLLWVTFNIVRKISVVSDEHNIRTELLMSVKTAGVAYVVGHIFYVILEIAANKHWAILVQVFFVCIAVLCVIYYSCNWTRKQFQFAQKLEFMKQMKGRHARRSSFTSFFTKRIDFQDIMAHRHGIESFCSHLANEFGLESVLFLLEVIQFKAIIRRNTPTLQDNVSNLCHKHPHGTDINNAETPSLSILSAENILNVKWMPIDPRMFSLSPHQIALHLYDKYIDENADLCINVSFGIRKGIYRFFQEITQQQNNASLSDMDTAVSSMDGTYRMYTVFDDGFTEIWRLLETDSFIRYKTSEEFRRLVSVLFPEESTRANANIVKMVDDHTRMLRDEKSKQIERENNNKFKIVIDEGKPMKKLTLKEQLSASITKNTNTVVMILNGFNNDYKSGFRPQMDSNSDPLQTIVQSVASTDILLPNAAILYAQPTNSDCMQQINIASPSVTVSPNVNEQAQMEQMKKELAIFAGIKPEIEGQYKNKSVPTPYSNQNDGLGSLASTVLKLTHSISSPQPSMPCGKATLRLQVYSDSGTRDDFII